MGRSTSRLDYVTPFLDAMRPEQRRASSPSAPVVLVIRELLRRQPGGVPFEDLLAATALGPVKLSDALEQLRTAGVVDFEDDVENPVIVFRGPTRVAAG